MSTKITLLLLAITGALLGFIFLYEKDLPKSWQASSREYFMLLFDRNRVEGIRLTSNEDQVELLKHGNQWVMEAPVKDRADQNVVAELLTLCETLQKEPIAEGVAVDKKLLKNFGVSKSSIRLKLLGSEMPPELLIGKETAVEGKFYARLEGSNNVSVIRSELRNMIVRKPDEFRDHRLADFDAASVTQVAVKTNVGEIELTRQADHWGLTRPLKARADDAKVVAFLNSVLATQIAAFQPDHGANLNSYGLSEPRGTVTFNATGRTQPVVLEIGARDEKTGGVYARISTRNAVLLLPKESENILKLAPNDLRDRRLMRVNLDLVDRITLRGAGKPPLVLQRAQEDWTLRVGTATRPANTAKVLQFVKELQTRPIAGFVTDVASDLAKYGFDAPQLRVTFSSYASENTAETNAGEEPILTLAFGKTEGNLVYAREEDEPFVVSVDQSLLDGISVDEIPWRSLTVFGLRPEAIVGLDVTTYTEGVPRPPVSLVLKDGQWAADAGSLPGTLNPINIQSLVNTLASLKAMQWTNRPAEVPPISETLEFKTQAGQTHKLMLGEPDADQSCLAWLDGDVNAEFRLASPDVSALRLPLVEAQPKP